MKVKLVFEKSYEPQRGLSVNSFSEDLEVALPPGFEMAQLVSAVCYDVHHGVEHPSSDEYANIWDYTDENRLVGKLLTYIDATYTDKEQREAHKSIIKDIVYGFAADIHERAVQTVKAHTE